MNNLTDTLGTIEKTTFWVFYLLYKNGKYEYTFAEGSSFEDTSEVVDILDNRVWLNIRVKWKISLKFTGETWIINFYVDSEKWFEEIVWDNEWNLLKVKLLEHWVTEDDILEAIKINLTNPFIEWEKTQKNVKDWIDKALEY